MEEKLVTILNEMAEYLSIAQMKKLQEVLLKNLAENEPQKAEISNAEYLQMFLDAKKSRAALKERCNITVLRWSECCKVLPRPSEKYARKKFAVIFRGISKSTAVAK